MNLRNLRVLFIHDTESSFIGGAEISNHRIIQIGRELGCLINYHVPQSFEETKDFIDKSELVILSSTFFCKFEQKLFDYLIQGRIPYVKYEHDYGFCASRDVACQLDSRIQGCCNPAKYRTHQQLFSNALLNVFLSPKHFETFTSFFGNRITNNFLLAPPIDLSSIHNQEDKRNVTAFLGNLNVKKGGLEFIARALENPEESFEVYGKNDLKEVIPSNVSFFAPLAHSKMLEELGSIKACFFKPIWLEPSGRVAAEAILSGCELISNDRIGLLSFPYALNTEDLKSQIEKAPYDFWDNINDKLKLKSNSKKPFGKVLVFKSHGGLGDVFISLPAILRLSEVCEELTYAIKFDLKDLFRKNIDQFDVINFEEIHDLDLSSYDELIDIQNYPTFQNSSIKSKMVSYPTHQKVKQHAVDHYIQGLGLLHKDIDVAKRRFPYFKREKNLSSPYFTIHAGAGFKPKCWPIENFELLIIEILNHFDSLSCVIISGPKDEDNWSDNFIKDRISLVKSDINHVAQIISKASFHIGNDSGISHMAGLFNTTALTIHGPSGPGTWEILSERKKVVWGKFNTCNIPCNFDTASNCSHRICLTSISAARIFKDLLYLLNLHSNIQIKSYRINPKVNLNLIDNHINLEINQQKLKLELKNDGLLKMMLDLKNHKTIKTDQLDTASEELLKVLHENEIILGFEFD